MEDDIDESEVITSSVELILFYFMSRNMLIIKLLNPQIILNFYLSMEVLTPVWCYT